MLRSILLVTALSAAPTAQADEVKDVLLLAGEQRLWIALDGRPDGLTVEARPGAVTLRLEGFQPLQPRTIEPASQTPVAAISIQPAPLGSDIMIEGGFDRASAELREGGVLVDFTAGRHAAMGEPSGPDRSPAASMGMEAPASTSMTASASRTPDDQTTPRRSFRIGRPLAAEERARAAPNAPPRPTPGSTPAQPSSQHRAASDPIFEAGPTEAAPAEAESWRSDPDQAGPCDASAAIVASSPWDLDALTVHAGCLVEIGEINNGAGLYERVLAFEPSHFQAALGLARIRERQGRRGDAARLFETAANSALTDGQALAARQAAQRLRDEN